MFGFYLNTVCGEGRVSERDRDMGNELKLFEIQQLLIIKIIMNDRSGSDRENQPLRQIDTGQMRKY